MSDGNIPSKDPADDGTLGGAFRSVFKKLLQNVDGMLPAKVIQYDRVTNMATVQPLVAVLTTDGAKVSRAQVARVPVLCLGAGGYLINFPVKAGDIGWLEASDRDTSLMLQGLKEAQPNTHRLHSFEDGRFIPDIFGTYTLAGDVGADDMVIQNLDGTVRIVVGPGRIRAVHPTKIEFEAPLGEMIGDFKVSGALEVTDTSLLSGYVTATAGAEIAGIDFEPHTHSGVDPGAGNSGPPNP